MTRKLEVEIVGDARSLKRALDDSDKKASGFGSTLGKLGKGAALAGGAAGIGALAVGLKIGIGEFAQAQKVAAQTNAVIKSTGGVANVTASHVGSLAEALMKKSGVDDEAIASGQNLLLTFTGIRNEVGKGNDIFDQATKAALDMSVALGTDMSSASMMLGKALNDPLKGMTKLQKQGVTFTDAQKATVKALVDTGKTAEAQKLVLAELNKEFGGSAEAAGKTLPGQLNIAKESFSNFAGMLVEKTIPVIQEVVAWIRDHWPEISAVIKRAWEDTIQPALAAFGELVTTVVGLVQKHWGTIGPIVENVAEAVENAVGIIIDALQLVTALLQGDWGRAWDEAKQIVGRILDQITLLWDTFKKTAVAALKGAGTAIKNALIEGLTGIGEAAWNVINNVGERIAAVPDLIAGWGSSIGRSIKNAVVAALVGIGEGAWGIINNISERIFEAEVTILGWGTSVGTWIKNAVVSAITGIGVAVWEKVQGLWTFLQEKRHDIAGWGKQIGGWLKDAIVTAVKDMPGDVWGAITGIFKGSHNPFRGGDARDPNMTDPRGGGPFGGDLHGALPIMGPFAQQAAAYGLHISAGRTDHAKYTKSGKVSDHWYGKALDEAGPASGMAAFFSSLIGNPRVKQAFYDPLGSIFGGVLSSYRQGGHEGHVHVATYDDAMRRARYLMPGLNLAYNGTGRPEPVGWGGGGTTIVNIHAPNYVGDRRELLAVAREEFAKFERRNGRSAL